MNRSRKVSHGWLAALLLVPLLAQARVEPRDEADALVPEPRITIVEHRDETLHIHQINGHIYGIRVIPKTGKPYNLVDINGSGKFITNAADRILVPEWVLVTF